MLSEINQAEKDKYHMISLICGFFKKKKKKQTNQMKTNKLKKKSHAHRYREQTGGCQRQRMESR